MAKSPISALARQDPAAGRSLLASFSLGIQHIDPAKQRRWTAVRHRCDLSRLPLAAIEGATEDIGVRVANGLHRAPEICCRRLIGNVLQLAGQLAFLDVKKPLPGELEVVTLHIDRPRLVAD